jgi:hypothetical protein
MMPPLSGLVPQPPLLIGLTGRAGAGKSTVAAYLTDQYAFAELALADPIVNMIGSLFADAGISGAWMVERDLKEQPTPLGYSYRRLAQTLGTEWGRALAPDFWLRVATARMASAQLLADNVVVSDIRFPNEAAWLAARGGTLVRVVREHVPQVHAHESEQHADQLPADAELINTGSKATLFEQVDRLLATIRKA